MKLCGPEGWSWIGRGKPLFPASDTKIDLQLAETRTFGNGVVLLRYQLA